MKLSRAPDETTCLTGFFRCPSALALICMKLFNICANKLSLSLSLSLSLTFHIGQSSLECVILKIVALEVPHGPVFWPHFSNLRNSITRQPVELESYPIHPLIQQVFYLKSKTNAFRLWWGVFRGWVKMRACFGNFGHFWPALSPNSLTHSFDIKFC